MIKKFIKWIFDFSPPMWIGLSTLIIPIISYAISGCSYVFALILLGEMALGIIGYVGYLIWDEVVRDHIRVWWEKRPKT